jgi:UDP-3-O-[3-hydroxymyristoyl] glucosamine N-acyltransferase
VNLSEIRSKVPIEIEIIKDGKFESLGFVTHNTPDQLVYIENIKYVPIMLRNSNISCVITTRELSSAIPKELGIGISINPRKLFYEIHNYLARDADFYWKPFKTEIARSAKIHPTAHIAETNVRIGERCEIGPRACILENSILENDVIIRAGSVIGTEGFEFNRIDKKVIPVIHVGGVVLHSRVEIQGNTVVDKAVFRGFTEIGEDTKVDNLVHIAHNVRIGKRCLIIALAMIGGSVTIGDDVWIGPSASIVPEIKIGDGASVSIGSVVTQDVAPRQRVTGNFAIDHEKFVAFLKSIR